VRRRLLFGTVGLLVAIATVVPITWASSRDSGSGDAAAGPTRSGTSPVIAAHPPKRLGRTDPAKRIRVGLALRLPNQRRLDQFLEDVQTPGSPRYRHFLSAEECKRRFGVPADDVAALRSRLAGRGFDVGPTRNQGTTLSVAGSVRLVGRTFGVHFDDYQGDEGPSYYKPVGDPRIPHELSRYVAGVGGLSNQPVESSDVPKEGLTPAVTAKAYNIQPLYDAGYHGEGQTIAVVSPISFKQEDLDLFDQKYVHDPGPAVERVAVDGGTNVVEGDDDLEGEVALDLQVIRGIAPKAQILNYEAPDATTTHLFADTYDQIVEDGRAKIVSNSYGSCELAVDQGDVEIVDRAADAAVAAGVSIFFASGDAGAYDCQQQDPTNIEKAIGFPGGSDNHINVGGTLLAVNQDNSYLEEQAWSSTIERLGTGGGISKFEKRPSWQTGPGVENADVNPDDFRQTPDVAGPADPSSGFAICHEGEYPGGNGGTSAAAPFWAGIMALVAQYAEDEGAGELGYANPVFYAIGADQGDNPPFNDVVHGNNRAYNATPGWDYTTGWGTPNAAILARSYVDYLKSQK
jgi:subtilase family serine protease